MVHFLWLRGFCKDTNKIRNEDLLKRHRVLVGGTRYELILHVLHLYEISRLEILQRLLHAESWAESSFREDATFIFKKVSLASELDVVFNNFKSSSSCFIVIL